ncbi:MAG: zinc ABC transporter substrate-binding protein [Flavobacteriaceae bacterium]|nr:zinc ABC transporter substrate-binding protein [Flavobacteriaceae bacterium]
MKKTILIVFAIALAACNKAPEDGKLQVVTTTTMITDLVNKIGGDSISVQGLMGSGVDPHLYKASEGDVSKLSGADIIFYNGLHLEGKLVEVFEKMKGANIETIGLAEALDKSNLIGSDYFQSNYDPHIWFDVDYWMQIGEDVTEILSENDPANSEFYRKNWEDYKVQLEDLKIELQNKISELPKEKRILVTAHDAFNYFGRAFDFEVVGLQGLSTATEAGVQDVQELAAFIIENNIKAIFVESSVPRRTIEALQAAVKSKGHDVAIGGTLYSDALGNAGTEEGEYIGMFRYNVNTIVNSLK